MMKTGVKMGREIISKSTVDVQGPLVHFERCHRRRRARGQEGSRKILYKYQTILLLISNNNELIYSN